MNTGKQQNGKNTAPRHRSAPRRSAAKAPQEMTIEERLRALRMQQEATVEAAPEMLAAEPAKPVKKEPAPKRGRPAKPAAEKAPAKRGRPAAKPASGTAKTAAGNGKKSRAARKTPVRIIPLGGLHEVGKNITVYECG